jgi:hypothetical protein
MLKAVESIHWQIAWCKGVSRADVFYRLKCNREKPCQNCIVRGESNAASCTYAEKVEKKNPAKSNPRSDAEDMRKRLNRLENSILSMMSSDEKTSNLENNNELNLENGNGTTETFNQAGGQRISADTRSTHWDAILHDVRARAMFLNVDFFRLMLFCCSLEQ